MITCAECRYKMSTMRLPELSVGSSVALHSASCADCAAIAQEVAYAERRLATALAEARPALPPEEVSERALDRSERLRRKTVGRWVAGLLTAAACVTFWFFMGDVFVPWANGTNRTSAETIALKCLTPEQASAAATPYLRSNGSAIYLSKDLHAITIKGSSDEFARAKAEITGIDSRVRCGLQPPSSGTPGKD